MQSHLRSKRVPGQRRWRTSVAVLITCLTAAVGAADAQATTITVNTTQTTFTMGDGLCSLQEAVDYANGTAEPDCAPASATGTTTIELPAGRYTPGTTLTFTQPTNIVGAGSGTTDIDGGGFGTVLSVSPSVAVTLSNFEVSGGLSATSTFGCTGSGPTMACPGEAGLSGGGITNFGTLTLQSMLVSGNRAAAGTSPIYPGLRFCVPCDGGDGGPGGNGGGIYNVGTLTISASTIANNIAGNGGAGTSGVGPAGYGGNGGNGGVGGGVFSVGTLVVSNSTISGNRAGDGGAGGSGSAGVGSGANGGDAGSGGSGGSGAGIDSNGPTTITDSTLQDNVAGGGAAAGQPGTSGGGAGMSGAAGHNGSGGPGGGALLNLPTGDQATLTNDTVSGNAAGGTAAETTTSHGGAGGGLAYNGPGTLLLTAVTIANNSAYVGGGIYVIPGTSPMESDSIIADNSATDAAPNCGGALVSDGGHNLVYGDSNCPGTNADPKLQALAGNGGPTQTLALGAGSAAINLVPDSACATTTDQRGVSRPQGSGCDAGAYESAPPQFGPVSTSIGGPQTVTLSGTVTPNLTDAKVTVQYGQTQSYGSTSSTVDAGSGAGASPVTITLSGLTPGTTYHARLSASNADGTTTGQDLTFTTPVAAQATFMPQSAASNSISIRLACATGGPSCSGTVKLTSRVTTRAGKVVGVAAAFRGSSGGKRRTQVDVVGQSRYTLSPGSTTTVKLSLNARGRRLLRTRGKLPALATFTGVLQLSQRVTFVYHRPGEKTRA